MNSRQRRKRLREFKRATVATAAELEALWLLAGYEVADSQWRRFAGTHKTSVRKALIRELCNRIAGTRRMELLRCGGNTPDERRAFAGACGSQSLYPQVYYGTWAD